MERLCNISWESQCDLRRFEETNKRKGYRSHYYILGTFAGSVIVEADLERWMEATQPYSLAAFGYQSERGNS